MGTALRVLLAVLCLVLVLGGAFWVFGPREPVDLTIRFDPASIGDDPEAYLKRREADIPNLRPSAKKEIVWADPRSKAKTPIAFVYLHGFSAAKPETRPLLDIAAREIGANLFYTRLTGHGRDPAAMPQTSVKDWLNDLAEAIAIGRRIGERVVIVGTSTGATLATLGASVPGLMDGVAGLVFISPNYAVNDPLAFMLEVPMARTLLPRLRQRRVRSRRRRLRAVQRGGGGGLDMALSDRGARPARRIGACDPQPRSGKDRPAASRLQVGPGSRRELGIDDTLHRPVGRAPRDRHRQ